MGQAGEQFGVIPLPRALDIARNDNLDLVEVQPMSQPPVCRLLDYGKFKYEQTRKEREARKTQKTQSLKEMRLRPNISGHDLDFKTKLIVSFLREGDKVKVTVNFKGRQNAHPELGRQVLEQVANRLDGSGSVERLPLLEGRSMTMILTPAPEKPKPQVHSDTDATEPSNSSAPPREPAVTRP
ncbi:MAG: translation initiation factor IF-3 [Chloroflexota bacterium]